MSSKTSLISDYFSQILQRPRDDSQPFRLQVLTHPLTIMGECMSPVDAIVQTKHKHTHDASTHAHTRTHTRMTHARTYTSACVRTCYGQRTYARTEQRFGAEEAHWAHNPRVGGSKLPIARELFASLIEVSHHRKEATTDEKVTTKNGNVENQRMPWRESYRLKGFMLPILSVHPQSIGDNPQEIPEFYEVRGTVIGTSRSVISFPKN